MGRRKNKIGHVTEEHDTAKSLLTDQEPSSKVSNSDDFVWDLPGLHKYEFYAAADYLRRHEKNQGLPRPANNTQASTNTRIGLVTKKLDQKMLDYLALLFARVKRTDVPAKHVTATALRKVDSNLEIWIAKNEGPKGDDEDIKSDLEAWFQRKGDWEKDTILMSSDLKRFWQDRNKWYADNIKTLWKRICEGDKPDKNGDSSVKVRRRRPELKYEQSDSDLMNEEPVGLVASYSSRQLMGCVCAFPFSINKGNGDSRDHLLLALKKSKRTTSSKKVLHQALDPGFNFWDNGSLAENRTRRRQLKNRRKDSCRLEGV